MSSKDERYDPGLDDGGDYYREIGSDSESNKSDDCKMPKCKKKNTPLFQGNCYPCHRTRSKERQNQHNSMCWQCATGKDEDDEILVCYAHGEQAEEDEDDPLPTMKD